MIKVATPVTLYGSLPIVTNGSYHTTFLSGGFSSIHDVKAVTQKAKGVLFLYTKNPIVQISLNWSVPKHLLFPAGFKFGSSSLNFPVFARPCPTVPRHGFVDSTVCTNSEELNALSVTTSEVEPGAELLVTKPIPSQFNVIINDGVITFASGNDGATSGKDVGYFYLNEDPLSKKISLDPALLLEGEVPFYEIVISEKGEVKLVQVRSAPGVPNARDYIPAAMQVKNVIKAEGDLLEWESKIKEVDPTTTIVDHVGGSLSSHYSIHAIVNKIPVFTTELPEVGSMIEPTVENADITDEDREMFRQAFIGGFNAAPYLLEHTNYLIPHYTDNSARPVMLAVMELALATLHNFSAISMAKGYDVLGLALGLFIRSTFAVSAGEARHAPCRTEFDNYFSKWHSDDREICYDTMFGKETRTCIKDIETIFYIFRDLPWGNSFGGKAWARCTESSIELYNASVAGKIEEVVERFNRVINEEHNGGKYLNKIISVCRFNDAAKDPSWFALQKLEKIVDVMNTAWEYIRNNKDGWEATIPYFNEIELLSPEQRKERGGNPYPMMKEIRKEIPDLPNGYKQNCNCKSCSEWHDKVVEFISSYEKKQGVKENSTLATITKTIEEKATKIEIQNVMAGTFFDNVWSHLKVTVKLDGVVKRILLPLSLPANDPQAYVGATLPFHPVDGCWSAKLCDDTVWEITFGKIKKMSVEGLSKPGFITWNKEGAWNSNDKVTSVVALPAITGTLLHAFNKTFEASVKIHIKDVNILLESGHYSLISMPYWWCLLDGTKVISKKALAKQINDLYPEHKSAFEQKLQKIKIHKAAVKTSASTESTVKVQPTVGQQMATTFGGASIGMLTFTSLNLLDYKPGP